MLPTTSRTMNFRVTARDNSSQRRRQCLLGHAGHRNHQRRPVCCDRSGGRGDVVGRADVTWNVAGTTNAPVNAASVNILLSTNGGAHLPDRARQQRSQHRRLHGPASDWSPPPPPASKSRRHGNIFFAISPGNFSIVPPANPTNYPPTLASVADRTIHAGCVLSVTNSATDPAVPSHPLAFSLEPGAPAGATIDAASGVISWPTTAASAGTTNTITVRVTQATSPNLSDAKSFTVVIVPAPALQPLTFSNGAAQLTWNAVAGQHYRVQYKGSLAATNWSDLAPDLTASGSSFSAAAAPGSGSQGYYRVLVLP